MDAVSSNSNMREALSTLRSADDEAIVRLGGSLDRAEAGNARSAGAAHRALKNVKQQGTQFISAAGTSIAITWSEVDQRFQTPGRSGTRSTMTASAGEAAEAADQAAANIADILTKFSQRDRAIRKADNYSLAQQDKSQFLREIFSGSQQGLEVAIKIAHAGKEQNISFNNVSAAYEEHGVVSASVEGVTTSSVKPIREEPILAFGFSSRPRKILMSNLGMLGFQKIQKMQDYMDGLQLTSESTFKDYCDFLEKAQAGSLGERINLASIQDPSAYKQEDLDQWATFLQNQVSEETFDFFHKLDTPEKRKDFFIKNCDLQRIYAPRNTAHQKEGNFFRPMIDAKRWDDLIAVANPGLDLLENRDNLSPGALKAMYQALSPEQKIVLDAILAKAFFRKTSKLGLTFAKTRGIPVAFAWTAPKGRGAGTSMKELHELLEIKPYKAGAFRQNEHKDLSNPNITQSVPEAVTFSEMRELYRLLHRGVAPDHILVREMNISEVEETRQSGRASSSSLSSAAAAPAVSVPEPAQSSFGIGEKKKRGSGQENPKASSSFSAALGSGRRIVMTDATDPMRTENNEANKKRK